MVTALHIRMANYLIDMAENCVKEAERILKEGEDLEWGTLKPTIKKLKKKNKISNDVLAASCGMSKAGFMKGFYGRTRSSFHTGTRWIMGLGATLCVMDSDGELYPLDIEPYPKNGSGTFNPQKFASFIQKGLAEQSDEDAEVWFQ